MLENPYMLLLIIPIFFIWFIFLLFKHKGIRFTSLGVGPLQSGLRAKLSFLPQFFLLATLILLVIVLAKPIKNPQEEDLQRDGIAIELVIDTSSSMLEQMLDGMQITTKMDAVKKAALNFTMGSEEVQLSGRSSDLLGIITFARYANTVYPLTFNRNPLQDVLSNINVASRKDDGTHFGAGLQMAIARLETLDLKKQNNIKSKVIVFLTDGQNRIDEIDPLEMAKLAKENNIIIYTIAFATRQQPLLQTLSEMTGGRSFEATNSNSLKEVYEAIDTLEKAKIGDKGEIEGEPDSFKYLFAALITLSIYLFLYLTLFRRFP